MEDAVGLVQFRTHLAGDHDAVTGCLGELHAEDVLEVGCHAPIKPDGPHSQRTGRVGVPSRPVPESRVMSEPTDRDPAPAGDTDWLIADEPAPDVVTSHAPGHRTALAAVALVAAGALVGGVAIGAVRSHTSDSTKATASQTELGDEQVPDGGFPSGQFAGGRGGVDGEQRLSGTVTAVSASGVTIRTSSGTTAYPVTAQTEIVRNGALASLSAVRAGDNVFVHLIPANGSSYVVERLFAQSGSGSTPDDDDANGAT